MSCTRCSFPAVAARRHTTWLKAHVWIQIVIDLAVLTVAIHFIGSVETPAVFMYLFHIILACIFFPPWQSLAVVATSASLYLACLAVETLGLDHAQRRYSCRADWRIGVRGVLVPGLRISASPSLIWVVIWYLASRLAGALRQRDRHLASANARLQASIEERARHMLQTTHQLKAPFRRHPCQRATPAARDLRSSSR